MNELLLCPFCDGEARLSLEDDAYYCEDCGAMPYVEKGCEPADVWNTRPRTIPTWLKTYLNEEIQKLNDLMQLAVKTRNPSAAHIISRCEEQQLILLQILDLEEHYESL